MKTPPKIILLALVATLAFGLAISAEENKKPRPLYTYSFGGLEDLPVEESVALLERYGYAGIAAAARREEELQRFDKYLELSKLKGEDFNVFAAFMAHRFGEYGFSDAGHRTAIDRIAGTGAAIWVWVRNNQDDPSITNEKVEAFIEGIFDYAVSKGVTVILYPHYNTYYPTVQAAMPLVKKINHPSFKVGINLCHEVMSGRGDAFEETFAMAEGHIGAIILSGSLIELDHTDARTLNASTILSLDESVMDLRPYLRLIRDSKFKGPIGFINYRLPEPEDYLERTMNRWKELCQEVGLYE